jgi:hypothetical protein
MVPPKKEGRRRIEGDRIKDVTRILVKKLDSEEKRGKRVVIVQYSVSSNQYITGISTARN